MARYPSNTQPVVEEPTETTPVEVEEPIDTTPVEVEEPVVEEPTETTPVEVEEPVVEEPIDTTPVEVEEPVVEEPTETTPVEVEEPVVAVGATVALNVNEIQALLAKPNMSVKDKLEEIKLNGAVPFKLLVAKLISYSEIMSPTAPGLDAIKGAGRNFDLYTVLKSIIGDENYNTFKVKFDIVNLFFKEYKNEAYSEFMLFRHSEEWKWGKENFTTYGNLITVITTLCDMSTRQAKLKTLLLEKAFNKTDTVLSETAIENLIKYYRA